MSKKIKFKETTTYMTWHGFKMQPGMFYTLTNVNLDGVPTFCDVVFTGRKAPARRKDGTVYGTKCCVYYRIHNPYCGEGDDPLDWVKMWLKVGDPINDALLAAICKQKQKFVPTYKFEGRSGNTHLFLNSQKRQHSYLCFIKTHRN